MQFHQHPTTFVNHLHLKVSQLERSLDFYKNILGFQVLKQGASQAQLSADGATALVTIEQIENALPLDPRTTGLFHIAYLLPERSDLATILQHLLQKNYPLQGASDHYVSEAIYLADPDGNGIEIYIDRNPDQWNWDDGKVEMASLPLDADGLMKEADANGWRGMPSGTIIGHIHLQVNELEKVKDFYIRGFGFDLVSIYGNQALFISSGGYHHHIGFNTWNSAGGSRPDENSIGLKSYTLSMPHEKRDQIAEELKCHGYMVEQKTDQYYVEDPAGNAVYF